MRLTVRVAMAAALCVGGGVLPALPTVAAQADRATWSPTLPATSAFDNLSAFSDGTAFATIGLVTTAAAGVLPGGSTGSTGFFRSKDFGVTWSPVAPPQQASQGGTSNLYVRFASPRVGYATYNGSSYIPPDPTGKISRQLCLQLSTTFRTVDGGSSWTPVCEPHTRDGNAMFNSPSPLAVGPDGRTVLVTGTESAPTIRGGKCNGPAGVVYFSTNSGGTWVRGALPAGYEPAWTAKIRDTRTALVLAHHVKYDSTCSSGSGDATALFLTTNGGQTYRRVLTCDKQPLCTTAAFVTSRRLIVGRTDGSTVISGDAGRTWRVGAHLSDAANDATHAANPDSQWWHWVQGFGFSDDRHGYASTRGAGTWRTTDGGRTWAQERSHECVYYPFGIGENAAPTPERSITGGPGTFSARVPGPADPGECHPSSTARTAALPPDLVVVRAGNLAVRLDGSVQRSAPSG